ncbi:MAG: hypothetical protein ACYC1M_00640 [Armatimonadota bacterium]
MERNNSQLVKGMAPYSQAVVLPYPSIFSDRWGDEAVRLLKKLGSDIHKQSWISRISCIYLEQVEYLGVGELDENTRYWGDYSDLAEEAFTAWMWEGNKNIPESMMLVPSAEWRAMGPSEYFPDAPMGALSGLYDAFMAQAVSRWQVRMMDALSTALSSKVAVGISSKGSYGIAYDRHRLWGVYLLDTIAQDSAVCKSVLLQDNQSWIPVDSLIARGVSVVGVQPEPNPQVAFLLHEASSCWTGFNAQYPAQILKMRSLLREMKLAVWDGLVSDLQKLPSTVKFVVIANACALSDSEMTALQAFIRKGQRHFLLVGAIGLINPDNGQWDVGRMQSVTGIPFSLQFTRGSNQCIWADNQPFGNGEVVPRCVSKLASSIRFEDGGNASGQRWLPSGKLNWCACAPLHIPLWRDWLTEAQVTLADPISAEV